MPVVVCGATCKCPFGNAPSKLVILPKLPITINGLPVASVADCIPMVNIMPFGMCSTLSNPSVAAATSAAFGVLTPMPCIPAIASPWIPSNTAVMLPIGPALSKGDKCMCSYGGCIEIIDPGQNVA